MECFHLNIWTKNTLRIVWFFFFCDFFNQAQSFQLLFLWWVDNYWAAHNCYVGISQHHCVEDAYICFEMLCCYKQSNNLYELIIFIYVICLAWFDYLANSVTVYQVKHTSKDYINKMLIWILNMSVISRLQQWIDSLNIEFVSHAKKSILNVILESISRILGETIGFNFAIINWLLHFWICGWFNIEIIKSLNVIFGGMFHLVWKCNLWKFSLC